MKQFITRQIQDIKTDLEQLEEAVLVLSELLKDSRSRFFQCPIVQARVQHYTARIADLTTRKEVQDL
jgi:hypothetical protein